MANNTTLPGTGEIIADEDISGIKYQFVFGGWGPAGTYNKPDIASGKSSPVQIRSHTGLIPLGEPTDPKSAATDGTSASAIAVLKQVSSSAQASAASLDAPTAGEYETVAASQTAQVLGGAGAVGDFISHLVVIPATISPGSVTLLDSATSITVFTGGTTSITSLVPFIIPLGMYSVSGAWKITTGANVSVIAVGKFT